MPELPEVHTTAKMLNDLLPGRKILDVWSSYGGVIHRGKNHIKNKKYFSQFRKKVVGEKIESVNRRGKNVLIHLNKNKTILVHMKMTGHLLFGKYQKAGAETKKPEGWEKEPWFPIKNKALQDPFNRFIRLVFTLSNGKHLVLSDVRKFAKVCLIEKGEKTDLDDLGPEPLDKNFNFEIFKTIILHRPNSPIKSVLMDQGLIAGIGNIYSDEILWLSGIHPESRVSKAPEEKLKLIFKNIKLLLAKGIKFKGDSTSDYRNPDGIRGAFQYHHKVYQRKGEKCLKKGCGGKISRIVVGGRSAHFCDRHQKKY